MQLKSVAFQKSEDIERTDWGTFHRISLAFIGDNEIITYQNHAFERTSKNAINPDDYQSYPFDLPADCALLSIRENQDLGYFLPLSNGAVLRIHTIALDDQFVEQLTYHSYAETNLPYDLTVKKWSEEAEEIAEVD